MNRIHDKIDEYLQDTP